MYRTSEDLLRYAQHANGHLGVGEVGAHTLVGIPKISSNAYSGGVSPPALCGRGCAVVSDNRIAHGLQPHSTPIAPHSTVPRPHATRGLPARCAARVVNAVSARATESHSCHAVGPSGMREGLGFLRACPHTAHATHMCDVPRRSYHSLSARISAEPKREGFEPDTDTQLF